MKLFLGIVQVGDLRNPTRLSNTQSSMSQHLLAAANTPLYHNCIAHARVRHAHNNIAHAHSFLSMAAAPENAANLSPSEARSLFRLNEYHGSTTGFCSGYQQANVTILPSAMADNFYQFCRRNHAAMPILYRSKPGEVNSELATDSDIRYNIIEIRTFIVSSKILFAILWPSTYSVAVFYVLNVSM